MRRLVSLVLLLSTLAPASLALAGNLSSMEEKALPRVLIQRGERFLGLGKPQAAMACYAKIFACCEGTAEAAEAHNDNGVALTHLGRFDEALAEYEKSLAGNYPLAHFNLGKAMLRRYGESRDPAARARARASFAAFRAWLDSGQSQPPAVSYNLQELREFLDQADKSLEE